MSLSIGAQVYYSSGISLCMSAIGNAKIQLCFLFKEQAPTEAEQSQFYAHSRTDPTHSVSQSASRTLPILAISKHPLDILEKYKPKCNV